MAEGGISRAEPVAEASQDEGKAGASAASGAAQTAKETPAQETPADDPGATISDQLDKTITIDQPDANGCKVDFIYARTRRYIIYDAGGQLRYLLPDDFAAAAKYRRQVAGLGGLRCSIEDLRADPFIGRDEATRAGREMAWAIGLAFDNIGAEPASEPAGVADQPKEILTRVDARLRSLAKSHFRKTYAFANLKAFAIIEFVLLLFVAALHSGVTATSTTRIELLHYALFGMFGALGAFLSVIAGLKDIDIDIDLGPWEHIFAGATRILIGLIGAWVVGLALDSALVDPTFGNRALPPGTGHRIGFEAKYAMYFILTFIGGFSQTLVPNLLKRGEDATNSSASPASSGPIVKDMKP